MFILWNNAHSGESNEVCMGISESKMQNSRIRVVWVFCTLSAHGARGGRSRVNMFFLTWWRYLVCFHRSFFGRVSISYTLHTFCTVLFLTARPASVVEFFFGMYTNAYLLLASRLYFLILLFVTHTQLTYQHRRTTELPFAERRRRLSSDFFLAVLHIFILSLPSQG